MLRIRAFGELAVELDGVPVTLPRSRRVRSLLAWLAVHPGPHPRARLAAIFWADVPDANARASLRSAVWALRSALGDAGEFLCADRETVELGGVGLWVDVLEFDRLTAQGEPADAVALCRGDLLAHDDDEWVLRERDERAQGLADALGWLAQHAERAGDNALAVSWARRRAALRPLDEAAGRELIRLLAASGDTSGAVVTYAKLSNTLRAELDVEPSDQTRALVQALRPSPLAPVPTSAPTVPDEGFVGRETDFRRLLDCWQHTRAGAGGAVLISGDGGIGKTRLAEQLIDHAARTGARTAGCAPGALSGAPLELWSELLAETVTDALADGAVLPVHAPWVADLARLLPSVAAHVGIRSPAHPGADPQHDRIRLFEAVVELLGLLAARRPLVLLLEDLHLADASSLELIGYAGRRVARLSVLLVLTRRLLPARPQVDGVLGALRARGTLRLDMTLAPLSPDAVRRIVRLVAPLSAVDVERIVGVADGSPLLAVEAARQLANGDGDPVEGLRTATRSALGRLSGAGRLFVELVATAGRDLSRTEVTTLPLLTDPARAATEALGGGLLRAREGSIGFRHESLRMAVYSDIADPMRVRLHDALAAELRRGTGDRSRRRAAELARHLRLAGHHQQAVGQLMRAATEARSVAALAEAAGFLCEATELDPTDPEPLIELGEVQAWRGLLAESDAAFERGIALIAPADTGSLASAWLRRGQWLRGGICHPRESRRSYQLALDVLDRDRGADPLTRAEALAGMAWADAIVGDRANVAQLLNQVDVLAAGHPGDLLTHDIGLARAHVLLRGGRFTDAYGPLIAAAAAAGRAGRPDLAYSCLTNAASAAACAGQFDRALDFSDRCLALVVPNGLLRLVVYAHTGRSAILRRLERYAEAATSIDLAEDAADRLGVAALDGIVRQERGLLAMATGDLDTAIDELGCALDADAPVSRPLTRLYRAEVFALAGRPRDADAELRAVALEPVSASDFPDTLVARMERVQGLIARCDGDHCLATRRFAQSARSWRRRVAGAGEPFAANLVDLGRPPLSTLVEPDRELRIVLADLDRENGSGDAQL
jgi:DNA-binding SARP family transcriptional activator/tetratricopeptide (TPR) repeat protein